MSKNIQKILESHGFDVHKEYFDSFFIHQCTPAGEDWGFSLSKLSDFVDYARSFDEEEEFEIWVEAKHNGVRGIPKYDELWKDQLWKKELLNEVAKEIDLRSKNNDNV